MLLFQVIKDNCNPIFDETFEYAMNQEEVEHKQLEVTVCTQKQLFQASSNVMGKVSIVNIKKKTGKPILYDIKCFRL